MADVFKKYSSIENAKPLLVEKVREFLVDEGHTGKPWAAMEKVKKLYIVFNISLKPMSHPLGSNCPMTSTLYVGIAAPIKIPQSFKV